MSDTRSISGSESSRGESKTPLTELYPARATFFPAPPPGADAVLGATLSTEIKTSPLGKIQHGVSHSIENILNLTEAIENCQRSREQGHSAVASTLGAVAGFVTEKLVAGTAASLIAGGVGTSEIGVGIPIATSGVLLMGKAKEAGKLANDFVPVLVDDTLDKFAQLKSSITQFVASAHQKFIGNESLGKEEYKNVEIAMVKLGYLQHLEAQGVYVGLDKNQKILYNWLARDAFNDYFQLNESGRLKISKPAADSKEAKIDSAALKREIGTIQTSLTSVQERYHIALDAKTESKSSKSISDEEVAQVFLAYGVDPAAISELCADPDKLKIARAAASQLNEYQEQLSRIKDQAKCLEFFKGGQHFFNALTQVGMFSNSRALVQVGQAGCSIMQVLSSVEMLTGCFSGTTTAMTFGSALGPMGMLIGAGISLITMFLGSGRDERAELEQKRAEQILTALHTISRQIEELHSRFDRIEGMIVRLSGMVRQVLLNQKILSDQISETYQLVRSGFLLMQSILHDFRSENRSFHERIHNQFSYLIGLKEIEKLQKLKESINREVNNITRKGGMSDETPSELRLELMKDKLIELESDLKKCCSFNYNGQKEFALLQHDPYQSLEFLARRLLSRDDALGFLAEEIERVTKKPLSAVGIKKELLPVTALWSDTVLDYVKLSRLPVFEGLDNRSVLCEIKEQSDNVLKFIQHIGKSDIIPSLLARHQEYINEFQEAIYQLFTNRKKLLAAREEKKSEEKADKILKIGEYFADGGDRVLLDKILHKIDYNYLLLNRFAYLGGLSPEIQHKISQLNRSTDLLTQPFNFNELPGSTRACNLCDASFTACGSNTYQYSYQYEHLEMIGGNLYGPSGAEKMVFLSTSGDSEDHPGGSFCLLNVDQYDPVTTGVTGGITVRTDSGSTPFPLLQYKGNFNTSANHVWASSHTVSMYGKPYFVLFTGGSGYAALYDITEKYWLPCDNSKTPARFHVPLHPAGVPNTTCYTQVIRDRYLIVNKVEWSPTNYPKIRFEAFDLQNRRWLASYEVGDLFTHTSYNPNVMFPWSGKPSSPNQFFINKVRPAGKDEAMVYGILQPGERLSLSVYYKPIDKTGVYNPSIKKDEAPHGDRYFPVKAKTINQTRSEVLTVDGENILVIPASITTEEGKNKLVFLSADFFGNKYEAVEYDLPPVHPNADWQAMRTAVAMIGGKPQLIVTLLNPDFRMMIFSYDPSTKKVTRLADGPTLEFLQFLPRIRVVRQHHMDQHLLTARSSHPGQYPVRPLEVKVTQSGDMSTLLIAYPKVLGPGGLNYSMQVATVPLAPILKVQPTSDITHLLATSSTSSSTLPKNLLTVGISRTQLLLSVPKVYPVVAKKETKPGESIENVLTPVQSTCKNIQKLFSAVMAMEIKIPQPIQKLINDDIKTMNRLIGQLNESRIVSLDALKKEFIQLQELFTVINSIDGYLKLDMKYSSGIAVNINRNIEQLKEEINGIKRKIAPHSPSKSVTAHVANGVWGKSGTSADLDKFTHNPSADESSLSQRR